MELASWTVHKGKCGNDEFEMYTFQQLFRRVMFHLIGIIHCMINIIVSIIISK